MSHLHNTTLEEEPHLQTAISHWSLVVIGSMSLGLNSLFVFMFVIFRRKFLTQTNNKILLSMTLADSLVGVSCIVYAGALITGSSKYVYEPIGVILLFGSMFTSIFSTSVMTLDRLIAIRMPLRYKAIMTRKRINALISLCWIIPALIVTQEISIFVKFSGDTELQLRGYILTVCFILGSAFLIISNIHLYRIIWEHVHVVRERLQTVSGLLRIKPLSCADKNVNFLDSADKIWQRELSHLKSELKEIKVAKFCIKIMLIFTISWLPLTIYRFSYSIGHRIGIPWLRRICLTMAILNSVANPILYLLTRTSFQKYMWRFLTCSYKSLRKHSRV